MNENKNDAINVFSQLATGFPREGIIFSYETNNYDTA